MQKVIDYLNGSIGTISPFVMLGIIMTAAYIWEVVK